MKIVRVEAIALAIPFTFGAGKARKLDICLVRVETDDGLTGWGEAFSYNCRSAVAAAVNDMIAPLAHGWSMARGDAACIAELHAHLQKKLHIFGRFGITAFALSGLDIALWDIAGKAAAQPVHRLLGADARSEVPCYASLLRYNEPRAIAAHCEQAAAEGYTAIKLHEVTDEAVAAARSALGAKMPLMVDVNCEWNRDAAVAMAKKLWRHDLVWLEEPVFPPEDVAGLRAVGEASGVAIASGENFCFATQFRSLMEARAVSYAQPSVTKVGGITEFLRVAALGMELAPHSPYFGPGALATLHLLAAAPKARFEYYYGRCEAWLFDGALEPRRGSLAVPQRPGLGCDPDPDVIRRYRA
jgi:L-alanine-DL-glutamate epimerase-like enolase superfamily enzyme